MFSHRPTTSNFRFRFRSEPGDPRKDDVVRSVPLSRKQIQRRRWALGWMVAKCLAISAVVICLLTFAARIWHESITVSPSFAVGDYSFHSNVPAERGGLTKDVITDVTGLRADLNVMKVDLTSLQTALNLLPQVQTAVVQRIFPNRIDIRITERQPVAWLACASREILPRDTIHGRLLDDKGVVFECRSLLHPYNHLPVINVPNLAWLQTGQALTDRRALQALSLIKEFNQQTWSVPLRIQEILLETDYSQTVTMTDGATVIFGTEKVPAQMQRLAKIYQWTKEHDRSLATAQLITELNVPVTFAPKGKTAAATTDAPKVAPKVVPATTQAKPASAKRPPISREAADIRAIVRGN
jgi:cell division septal protein FtsQ